MSKSNAMSVVGAALILVGMIAGFSPRTYSYGVYTSFSESCGSPIVPKAASQVECLNLITAGAAMTWVLIGAGLIIVALSLLIPSAATVDTKEAA